MYTKEVQNMDFRSIPALISPCASEDFTFFPVVDNRKSATNNVEEKYLVDPIVVGSGHHGSVRKCIDRKTGQQFAIKSVRKSDPAVNPDYIHREILLLNEVKHPNIIRLSDVFEDEEYLHIVTDLCQGGELFHKIVEKASDNTTSACFSEEEAARIIYQVLDAVRYLHQHNIVHRDIKPENILFDTIDKDSPVKIVDFGLARMHFANEGAPPMTSFVGTPYYIAPDVIRRRYGKACDLWSVGVVLYTMLCGYPPFLGQTNADVYESIRRGFYRFPEQEWGSISYGAKDFINRLLQRDPRNRMTAEKALNHPWIRKQLHKNREISKGEREDVSVEVVLEQSKRRELIVCFD